MPSSLTVKSSALRVKTSWPDLVLTRAGTTTSEERTLIVALGLVSEEWASVRRVGRRLRGRLGEERQV